MPTTSQERAPGEQNRRPIFTRVGGRGRRRPAAAIVVLMFAGVEAVSTVVVANSVG